MDFIFTEDVLTHFSYQTGVPIQEIRRKFDEVDSVEHGSGLTIRFKDSTSIWIGSQEAKDFMAVWRNRKNT